MTDRDTIPEPPNDSIVLIAHPADGKAEEAWLRDDAAADEGEYGDQHWYPLGRIMEDPPQSWYELTELQYGRARLFVVTATEEIGGSYDDASLLAVQVMDRQPPDAVEAYIAQHDRRLAVIAQETP